MFAIRNAFEYWTGIYKFRSKDGCRDVGFDTVSQLDKSEALLCEFPNGMNSAHLFSRGVSNYRDTSVKMILETSLKLKCRLVLSIMIYCCKNHGKELLIVIRNQDVSTISDIGIFP
jgi:hypothetical protein